MLGPIDPSRLGFTLAHEHVADAPDVLPRWPRAWGGKAQFVARAIEELKTLRGAGVDTIVDLTTYDVGRDIRFLREVSRKSGLNIIAATGQRFFPPQSPAITMPSRTVEGLTAFFAREIAQGIDGTRVKAGVVKIGIVGKTPTELEMTGLRAGTRAAMASGVPLRIHSRAADKVAEKLAVILGDEGMDPAQVSFDHSDDSGDMDYFLGLVRHGYCLGMDHVHRGLPPDFKPSFERRAECIKLLVDAGFADKIFLSQDVEFGGAMLPPEARQWRETIDPAEGMLFGMRRLIPRLKQIGVPDGAIHTMTVDNPRRFFSRI
ncbi:MAG: hypothetical protein U1E93_10405 [Alphaproteobacteria bacterium]